VEPLSLHIQRTRSAPQQCKIAGWRAFVTPES
jgi:hypothetical protein